LLHPGDLVTLLGSVLPGVSTFFLSFVLFQVL
jgi:hypothetical protein